MGSYQVLLSSNRKIIFYIKCSFDFVLDKRTCSYYFVLDKRTCSYYVFSMVLCRFNLNVCRQHRPSVYIRNYVAHRQCVPCGIEIPCFRLQGEDQSS